jgi:hypothetical protein
VLLQQQYRERGFKKYSELISCFLVVGQNNELLINKKKFVSRTTGSTPFLGVNAMRNNSNYGCGHDHGRSTVRESDHEQRRINFDSYDGNNSNKPSQNKEKQENRKNIHSGDIKKMKKYTL